MADTDGTLRLWSTTASNNKPSGSTSIGTGLDDNLREIQKVVRQYLAAAASDMASSGTVDLSTANGFFVNITGTTSITSFGTENAGIHYLLKFAGSLTLTHNATSLILPGGVNIQTQAGDLAWMISEGSGNWRCAFYQPAQGEGIRLGINGADVASAATLNLDTSTGLCVDVTGTTTITAITLGEGDTRVVRFTGALTLTHGASLVLPNAANITTVAGDYAIFRGYSGGVVRCVNYSPETGANVGAGGGQVFRDHAGRTLNFRTLTTVLSGPAGAAVSGISADTSGDTFRVVYTMTSPSAPSSPSGPGGSSLHPDSLIEMADGKFEWLCDIRIGDKVKGVNGEMAEVLGIWRNVLNERPLFYVNGVAVTAGHLFKTESGWACCSAEEYRKRYGDHYVLKTSRGYLDIHCGIVHPDEVRDLALGDTILVAGGKYVEVVTIERFETQGGDNKVPAAQEVISLYLDNAKAYYCDGYAVSTIA